jgi:hypothetical protein
MAWAAVPHPVALLNQREGTVAPEIVSAISAIQLGEPLPAGVVVGAATPEPGWARAVLDTLDRAHARLANTRELTLLLRKYGSSDPEPLARWLADHDVEVPAYGSR